jgi:sarcosine oxidase gamma subunit
MAELAVVSIPDQIGLLATDPVGLAELPGAFLVSGAVTQAPNTIAEIDGGYACWMAPNRALAITLTPPAGFVSDITHGQAVFTIAEPQATAFLAMGCTLPPEALAPGRCAQTLFAGLKVLLYRRNDLIHLHIERALAAWQLAWFRQAATAL